MVGGEETILYLEKKGQSDRSDANLLNYATDFYKDLFGTEKNGRFVLLEVPVPYVLDDVDREKLVVDFTLEENQSCSISNET